MLSYSPEIDNRNTTIVKVVGAMLMGFTLKEVSYFLEGDALDIIYLKKMRLWSIL